MGIGSVTEAPASVFVRAFDAVDHPVYVIGADGTIELANRATGELLGIPPGDLLGRRCHEVFHERPDFIEECPFRRSCLSGHRESTVIRMGNQWFIASVDPLEDGGAVHSLSDITRLRETEAMLTGFLTETVLRLVRPAGVMAETLTDLAADLESGHLSADEVALVLRCEAAGLRGLSTTIRALEHAVASGVDGIPEDYRRFLLE